MTTNLSLTDQWNATPTGPITGEPHTAAAFCANLGQLTQNETFLYNRLIKGLIGGSFKTFAAGNVNTGSNQITITGHGIAATTVVHYGSVGGTALAIGGVTLPTNEAGLYGAALYVNVIDANTITLAATSGGSALDITNAGGGTHYLWIVPAGSTSSVLSTLMSTAISHAGGQTIPASTLYAIIAGYMACRTGDTFTGNVRHEGEVTHSNKKVTRTGDNAYVVSRIDAITDTATQTISGTAKDVYYVPDVSQNSTVTIDDPPAAGIGPIRYSRRNVGGGFAVALRRADASLVATLPNTGASWVDLWSHEEDGALAWHVEGHGGDATNID